MVFIEILIFLVSIGTLWFSSDMVTKQMGPIAARLGVSELVVTVLGVSVLSSLPELTICNRSILPVRAS